MISPDYYKRLVSMYIEGKSYEELTDEIDSKKLVDIQTTELINEIHQENFQKRTDVANSDLTKTIITLLSVVGLVIFLFKFQDKIKPSPLMLLPLLAWIPFFRSFYSVITNWKYFEPIEETDSFEDSEEIN